MLSQQLQQPEGPKHGMCMAVQLLGHSHQHALLAFVGYEDGEVAVWDVFKGKLLASKHMHDEPVMALALNASDASSAFQGESVVRQSLSMKAT